MKEIEVKHEQNGTTDVYTFTTSGGDKYRLLVNHSDKPLSTLPLRFRDLDGVITFNTPPSRVDEGVEKIASKLGVRKKDIYVLCSISD